MTTDGVQMQGAQQSGGKDVAGGPTQEVATEQALLSPSTAAEPGVRLQHSSITCVMQDFLCSL